MEWRIKAVEQSIAYTDEPNFRLRTDLTWWDLDLTVFGVSVVIGVGIFTLTASTAGNITGPVLSVSFLIAAVTSGRLSPARPVKTKKSRNGGCYYFRLPFTLWAHLDCKRLRWQKAVRPTVLRGCGALSTRNAAGIDNRSRG